MFGAGGGDELVSLGGISDARNQSLAYGVDHALSSSLLADFRFGWFKYRVNVLPSDFGTTPATDAGIRGLNLDNTFASGLPAFFIGGDSDSRRMAFGSGLGDRVGRCNCPLDQDEQQFQVVGNVTKMMGNHSIKFGIDVRRAYNLRVPSDRHRSGELNFENDRTRGPAGGGLALASFMLGDVTRFTRYVSPTTDARERQWRHFYYAQDVFRPTPKLTLNYGLRLDVINPQTVNEAGNGGFLDLVDRPDQRRRRGRHRAERQRREHAQLGASPWRDLPADREDGPARRLRQKLRHRRLRIAVRPQRHPEPAGAVGAGTERAATTSTACSTSRRAAPAPVFPAVPASGQFALPNGVFARALPDKQRPPHVDAFNVMVQHQLTDTISVEAGYVGNRGGNVFAGDGPATNVNQAILTGFPNVSTNQRRPFFAGNVPNTSGFGGAFGWTQGIDYFCNCATNAYDSLQTRFTKRFSGGYSVQASYTLQRAIQDNPDYFFFDSEMNRGPADWDRTHNFTLSLVAELPFGRERRYGIERLAGGGRHRRRLAGEHQHVHLQRPAIPGDVPRCGRRSRHRRQQPPQSHRRSRWAEDRRAVVQRDARSARPAAPSSVRPRGTFGTMDRNALRGPGYWRVDASLFKHFSLGGARRLEARIEAVNLFNNVNLANPDSEVGVPGNPNTNAGRINGTAVRRQRSDAELPVRVEVHVLSDGRS